MTQTNLDTQTLSLIEEHVRRLLESMSFVDISVRCKERVLPSEKSKGISLEIIINAGDDGKLLIGTHGAHLSALQHIIRSVLRRQLPDGTYITLDVNGYRSRHEQTMTSLAEAAARRAKMQGKTVVLSPMSASDRRLVHTTLAQREDVKTHSMGDEPDRRVVIKPVFL